MFEENTSCANKPNSSNILEDVVVDVCKADVVTPKFVMKTLYRDYASGVLPCILMSAFLLCPIMCCILFYNDTFQWQHMIFPVIMFILGVAMIGSRIAAFVKTQKRRNRILRGEYVIQKANICNYHSEYNSPAECDDYYIKIPVSPKSWIKVPEEIYHTALTETECYLFYLPEKGENVLFLIYIGACRFDK